MEKQIELKGENDNAPIQKEKEEEVIKLEEENKRYEAALTKRKELLLEADRLKARNLVGGQSEAGLPQKTETDLQREKTEAEADRIYSSIYTKKRK